MCISVETKKQCEESSMKIRQARLQEISEIMKIYDTARKFMKEHGNPTQWKTGYPSKELVERDCNNGWLYVCEEQDELAGVFMFYKIPEPNYEKIYDGQWLNEDAYGTMHRMASSGKVKGIASFCLEWCFKQCKNLKGDTHEDNYVMQSVFEKNGFQKCGIIHVEDGTPRIAYQRVE